MAEATERGGGAVPDDESGTVPPGVAPPGVAPRGVAPPRGAMLAIVLIVFTDLLGFGLIIPQLPFYGRRFAASDFVVTLIFAAYSVCQLAAGPVLGSLSDRFGRRPVLVVSQAGSVVGFLCLGLAIELPWAPGVGLGLVFLARIIDGISGGNVSTAQAYVSDVTSGAERAKGMGKLGAAFGVGFAVGPAVGGLLGAIDPAWPAWAAAACSAAAAGATYFLLPESHPKFVGIAKVRGVAIAAEPIAPAARPSAPRASALPAFLDPARLRAVFGQPEVAALLAVWFFSMFAFVMLESTFALFLADEFGYGPAGVGGFFTLAGVTIVVVQGGLIGPLTKRLGEWPLVIAGPTLVAAAMGLFTLAARVQGSAPTPATPTVAATAGATTNATAGATATATAGATATAAPSEVASPGVAAANATLAAATRPGELPDVGGPLRPQASGTTSAGTTSANAPVAPASGGGVAGRVSRWWARWATAGLGLVLLGGLVNATGRSLQTPTLSSLLSKSADPQRQGVTFGVYGSLGSLARAVGPVLAGLLYTWRNTGPFLAAAVIAGSVAVGLAALRLRAARAG